MMIIKTAIKRVLLALNMFVLHLLTGRPDLTISGWSYIRAQQGKRSPIKLIDWLFLKLSKQEDYGKDTNLSLVCYLAKFSNSPLLNIKK
ncbi:hypothetical protein ACQZND_000013 [Vibrio alginolyticus]